MKRTAESWDARVSIMLTKACAAAESGDPLLGSFLISSVIENLKTGAMLPVPLAEYLAKALEKCLADPANARKALGLSATKGRRKRPSAQRDFEIVRGIFDALTSGQSQEKAFAAAAGEHHLSEGRVAQLWRASRMELRDAEARKTLDDVFIDLSCEPSKSETARKIKLEK